MCSKDEEIQIEKELDEEVLEFIFNLYDGTFVDLVNR